MKFISIKPSQPVFILIKLTNLLESMSKQNILILQLNLSNEYVH